MNDHPDNPPAAGEPLPLVLADLLDELARPVDPDELLVTTGIAWLITATDRDQPIDAWPHLAHDVFLASAARDHGLDLRELHPPAAAPPAPTPPEYELHFRDSYLPFIRSALARGQRVLAWRGWPAPLEYDWGLITAVDEAAGRCIGTTPNMQRAQPMSAAPAQVFVVQATQGNVTSPAGRVAAAVVRAAQLLAGAAPHPVRTGTAAMQTWRDLLATRNDDTMPNALIDHAKRAVARRRAAARFLRSAKPQMPDPLDTAVQDAAAELCRSAGAFDALQVADLVARIDSLIKTERDLTATFNRLAAHAAGHRN